MTEDDMNDAQARHELVLNGREELILTGILDVMAFDESGALLKTALGLLSVDGEGLHVRALSVESGEMTLEGRINALIYLGEREASSKKKRGHKA